MAFTVADFEDLVRPLEEHPDWRERLAEAQGVIIDLHRAFA